MPEKTVQKEPGKKPAPSKKPKTLSYIGMTADHRGRGKP